MTSHSDARPGLMRAPRVPGSTSELASMVGETSDELQRKASEFAGQFDVVEIAERMVAAQTAEQQARARLGDYNDRANARRRWSRTFNGERCLGCDTPLRGDQTRLCPQCDWDGPRDVQGPTLERVPRPGILESVSGASA